MRVVAVLLGVGGPLCAQQASPYVPLQHWAMPTIEHLIATGTVADPSPLTRPFKASDLLQALRVTDTVPLSPTLRETMRRLVAAFTPREQGDRLRVEVSGGLAAASHPYRDPLEIGRGVPARPRGPNRLFGGAGVSFQLQFGSLVASTFPYEDTRLRFDPDWYDGRRNGVRFSDAYLSGQWRYGEVFFGVLDRNWGPSGVQGLLLSDVPYNLDHLAVTVGPAAIRLQALVAQLDTRPDPSGAPVNRYMFQHRLVVRPRGRWTMALWEGNVWSGVGRQMDLWYMNLLIPGWLTQGDSGVGNVNNLFGLDLERRGAVTLFGQVLLDDIQTQNEGPADLKPTSYGFTAGAKGKLGGPAAGWMMFYTQVGNLTYRNEDDLEVPLFHFLGTGRNFADYDQLTAKASVLAGPGLLLEPEFTLLRQGEGDPRLPHPPIADYATTATLFQGVIERTVRLALAGSWERGGWQVSGNGGLHLVRNFGHVSGASLTRWVGSIGVTYRFHREVGLF